MESKDKEEILVAIAKLEEKNEHLQRYIYKDLRPHIQNLCDKIENCVEKSEECYHKTLRWMMATITSLTISAVGWILWALK